MLLIISSPRLSMRDVCWLLFSLHALLPLFSCIVIGITRDAMPPCHAAYAA